MGFVRTTIIAIPLKNSVSNGVASLELGIQGTYLCELSDSSSTLSVRMGGLGWEEVGWEEEAVLLAGLGPLEELLLNVREWFPSSISRSLLLKGQSKTISLFGMRQSG